jgi:hypothetical protein
VTREDSIPLSESPDGPKGLCSSKNRSVIPRMFKATRNLCKINSLELPAQTELVVEEGKSDGGSSSSASRKSLPSICVKEPSPRTP